MPKRMLALAVAFVLFLLPTAAAHAQAPASGQDTIYLQAGAFDPLAAPAAAAAAAPVSASPYYLVQFTGPVEALWLAQVAALGGEVVGYIPNNTHIVRMAPSAVAAVQSLPSVRWVGPYRPAYKVAPELAAASAAATARAGAPATADAAAAAAVELTVIAFPGESLGALRAALTTLGAGIVEAADTTLGPVLRIQAPLSLLPSLAQQPGVSWVERYLEPSVANAEGRKIIGAEAVWQSFGYYGSGQTIAISDSGLSVQGSLSPDFAGRLVRAYAPSEMNLASAQCTAKTTFTDLNGHGTHVAGSVLGSGARSGSSAATHAYTASYAGTAPEASLVFMALNTDGSSSIQCVDLNGDFLNKGYQDGARISSNSWGASDRGGYNQISSLVDDYIWRHKDYLVLYAAGNAGPGAQTVGSPGTAKNVLTIGASENNRPDQGDNADEPNTMADFSSRGPTTDGRLKPDVVAPGTWVLSVRAAQAPDGSYWAPFNQDYAYMGGTSMATPLSAGGAAIVREWLNKARSIAAPSAALLKAIIVNGATQLPGEPLGSTNSGYGRLDLKNTLGANYVILDDHVQGLKTGDTVSYTVQVVASSTQGTLVAQGADPLAVSAAQALPGAISLVSAPPLVAASAAVTTPEALQGQAVPGYDAARPLTRIPDVLGPTAPGQKGALTPLPNAVPAFGNHQAPRPQGAAQGAFTPRTGSSGLALQNYQQQMVGGGDFEDPDWTDVWSYIWLGSGLPVRTDDPDYVVGGSYSMWLGGTLGDGTASFDTLFYPVQFPAAIDDALASGIAFSVRIADQDAGTDYLCVALIDASGSYIGPYAPDNPECIDANGDWNYSLPFSADDRAALAGQTAYLIVFNEGNGVAPNMSTFVDDISLLVDFPSPTATITPAAGPPGTTFLLTGKFNTPYGWVDICISPCSPDNYITTAYADAGGDIAAFLDASADIAPGPYLIQTSDLADRTADTQLSITGAADPSLSVDPTSGPAGATFQFSGSDFIPNDTTIAVTLNGAAFGTIGSDGAGAVSFKLTTSANTPAGAYTVQATDSGGRSAEAAFSVTAVPVGSPKLAVTPASGPPGTTFTFVASSFTANAPADVSLDGQALGQVNIDAAGAVTLTLSTTGSTAPARYTLAVVQGARSASAAYEVTAGSGTPLTGQGLYVTLAWTDPPAQSAAGQKLVNDLDLTVDGPGGRVFGNGGTAADRKNNVEAVRIEKPVAGAYVVTVRAASVNGAFGAQPYALVATSKQNFGTGSSVDLGQPNAGALSGVVFADLDRNGVRATDEPGLAGIAVVVRQVDGALNRQAATDAAGSYQLTDLPAGDYAITVVLPQGLSPTTPTAMTKTVVTGSNTAPAIGAATILHLPHVRR